MSLLAAGLVVSSIVGAAPPPVVVDIDCPGLADSRHALILTGLTGREVASTVVAVAPDGRTRVVLNPSAIPAQAALVGDRCNLQADISGGLGRAFQVRLSADGSASEPPGDPNLAAAPDVDVAMALTLPELRTPRLLGDLLAQALAEPPGNQAETLLARVPRLEGHPDDPRITVRMPDGRSAVAVAGAAASCPDLPAGSRTQATRVGDVVVLSGHSGPFFAVPLPGDPTTVGQVIWGCAPQTLWFAEDRRRDETRQARKHP